MFCSKNIISDFPNLKVGDKISIQKSISEEDLSTFSNLTDDYNPIHDNSTKKVVHGALLNGILSGILGTKLPGPGTVVVEQILHFPKPCFVGEQVEFSVKITAVRKIVKCDFICVANSERIVMKGEAKLFVNRNIVNKLLNNE